MADLFGILREQLLSAADPAADGPPVGLSAYFGVVLLSAGLQAISMLALLAAAIHSIRRAFRSPRGPDLHVRDPVAVVVPCYLPNEAPIIMDTIQHLLDSFSNVDTLTIYVVYNTPVDLPIEQELNDWAERGTNRPGRQLVVLKVPGSRSKAENLNHVIPDISAEYVAVYDADHHPDPDSLAMAVMHLKDRGCDCVQGSTYIREGFFLFRWLIQAEFFVNYFVVLPAMQAAAGTGFFGGANGVWLTSSLKKLQFDEKALTEDIDCFARAIIQHDLRFEFLPESCSGELLPAGPASFWKQRLRWAMGWDQVTVKHAPNFWGAPISMRRRLGLCYIFFCRWFTQVCALFIVVFNARSAIEWKLAASSADAAEVEDEIAANAPPCLFRVQVASFYGYCLFMTYAAVRAILHKPTALFPGILMYFVFMPFYVIFNSVLMMVSLVRVSFGSYGTWVVTSRAHGGIAVKDQINGLGESLLGDKAIDSGSNWVLGFGFVAQGLICGAIVGDVLGSHQEEEPLWGWVPFGLGAKTVTVLDYQVVALCMAVGVGMALLFFVLTLLAIKWFRPCGRKV